MGLMHKFVLDALLSLQAKGIKNRFSASEGVIVDVAREVLLEPEVMTVDVLVTFAGGRQVVIEVDGPWHSMVNTEATAAGHTLLRNRLLERRFGKDNVVSVPTRTVSSRTKAMHEDLLQDLLGMNKEQGKATKVMMRRRSSVDLMLPPPPS
jgi:hypothetical protein